MRTRVRSLESVENKSWWHHGRDRRVPGDHWLATRIGKPQANERLEASWCGCGPSSISPVSHGCPVFMLCLSEPFPDFTVG